MSRRLTRILCALVALSLLLCLAACGEEPAAASAPPTVAPTRTPAPTPVPTPEPTPTRYELTFSLHISENSAAGQWYQSKADELSSMTDGLVSLRLVWDGALYSAGDVADGVEDGGADLGLIYAAYYPGQFPLSQVLTFPVSGFGDAVNDTELLAKLADEYPQLTAEWQAWKLLCLYGSPGAVLANTEAPVDSIYDMWRLKLSNTQPQLAEMLRLYGARAVKAPSIAAGLTDGSVNAFALTPGELLALEPGNVYCTDLRLYGSACALVMNLDTWQSLPEEYRTALETVFGAGAALQAAQALEDADAAARKSLGAEWSVLDAVSLSSLRTRANTVNTALAKEWDGISPDTDYPAFLKRAIELAAAEE